MLFLKKRLSLATSLPNLFLTSANKLDTNVIRSLTEKIELYIEGITPLPPQPLKSILEVAKHCPYNKPSDYEKTLIKLGLKKTVDWAEFTFFLSKLVGKILESSTFDHSTKKSLSQMIFARPYRENEVLFENIKDCLGSEGMTAFMLFVMENQDISEEKAIAFNNHMKNYQTKKGSLPTIIGFFGSHHFCPLQIEGLEACAGVILKQESKDTESCASGYTLYVFDDTLKTSIEEEVTSQQESANPKEQEPVFDLNLLRELCCLSANEPIKNEVEFTLIAELLGTPSTISKVMHSGAIPVLAPATDKIAELLGTPRSSYLLQTPARHTDHNTISKVMHSGAIPVLAPATDKAPETDKALSRKLFDHEHSFDDRSEHSETESDDTAHDASSIQGSDSDVVKPHVLKVNHDLGGRNKQPASAVKRPESRAGSSPFSPAGPMGAATASAGRSFPSATDRTTPDPKWENYKTGRSGVEDRSMRETNTESIDSRSPGKLRIPVAFLGTGHQKAPSPAHGKAN